MNDIHSFRANSFNYITWRNSSESFECEREPKGSFTIMCQSGWDSGIREYSSCQASVAGPTSLATYICIILLNLVIIGVLSFYSHRLRKVYGRYLKQGYLGTKTGVKAGNKVTAFCNSKLKLTAKRSDETRLQD